MQELQNTTVAPLKSNGVKAHVSGGVISRPILFSADMVEAILDGRKTQTRRIISEKIVDAYYDYDDWASSVMPSSMPEGMSCSRQYEKEFFTERAKYCPEDFLYVKENFWAYGEWVIADKKYFHYYGGEPNESNVAFGKSKPMNQLSFSPDKYTWHKKPSIFLHKKSSRILLKVINVRVQRLQSISEEDANCEGVKCDLSLDFNQYLNYEKGIYQLPSAVESFKSLWSEINGRESWNANPFVWVIQFEVARSPKHHR